MTLHVRPFADGDADAVGFYRRLGYATDDVIGMGKRLEDDRVPGSRAR